MKGMHGIIFSYGEKPGLGQLTANRIHGSLPFGGDYRVVDFILSNMVNAGITDVGVIMHGKCQSMLDHLGTGKSWDLSRKTGGLKLLPAFAYSESRGVVGAFRGKMEALGCVIEYLRHIRQDYVVLSDSDLVTNLPLTRVLEAHIASGADMTCVCTSHPGESGDTYFKLDNTGRIVDTAYDIRTPEGYQSLNIFLLGRDLLLELVEDCMAHDRYSFRHNVLQDKGKELRFNGYVWDGFAARINSVQGYYQRSMELLRPEIRAELFCPQRPVYAKENDAASTYIDPSGECVNSLISDGCDIQGSIRNCILFRGVRVEKGAHVENSILFKNTVVRSGASIRCVIADKNVEFAFNTPLKHVHIDKMHLYSKPPKDSLWYEEKFKFDQKTPLLYTFRAEWKPGYEYSLELDSLVFEDIYGTCAGPSKQGLKVKDLNQYATIMFTLNGMEGKNVVCQLLNTSDNPVKEVKTTDGNVQFYYVAPGTYYLRLYVDENNNGMWDTGVFAEGRQPEPVYYYHEAIQCKANWDFSETWTPTARSLSSQKPSQITKQKADKKKTVKSRNLDRAKSLGIQYVPKVL